MVSGRTHGSDAMPHEGLTRLLKSRRRAVAAGVLCAGLAMALVIYVNAAPPADDAEEWPENSKPYLRQMELYGGKANVLANQAREWFDGLWHGRPLAYTVGCLSVLSAGLTLVVLTALPDDETKLTGGTRIP
jgi:hypothetical protein